MRSSSLITFFITLKSGVPATHRLSHLHSAALASSLQTGIEGSFLQDMWLQKDETIKVPSVGGVVTAYARARKQQPVEQPHENVVHSRPTRVPVSPPRSEENYVSTGVAYDNNEKEYHAGPYYGETTERRHPQPVADDDVNYEY